LAVDGGVIGEVDDEAAEGGGGVRASVRLEDREDDALALEGAELAVAVGGAGGLRGGRGGGGVGGVW